MGVSLLNALKKGVSAPEEIAKDTGIPLFRVRSSLRNLTAAGYAAEQGEGGYKLSEQGVEFLNK
jgi:predicted transcriptional regulator